MSKCVSQRGEYNEHTLDDGWGYICAWCGVLDEDALIDALDAAVARAEAAEQAVQRVRELHQKRAFTKYEYCVECDVDERAAPWPCDTIRVLDGTP